VTRKKDPRHFDDCNLKKDDRILIIFGTSIPDTTGHSMAVSVLTSPSVCSCTTGEIWKAKYYIFIKGSTTVWLFN